VADLEDGNEEEAAEEVPEGAAVLPNMPAELGVDPLLLAVLHATVFLDGSDPAVVNAAAAREAMDHLAGYLQRLDGSRLRQVREDLACLVSYARTLGWNKQQMLFLKEFLSNYGVGEPPA
jgi:hypothetical protein